MNNLTNISKEMTMSSREIAELCEKRHDHVKRDIEKMFKDVGVQDAPKFGEIYLDQYGREQNGYRLPKDLTMTLVTGYRADLRFKVIKRVEELEANANDPIVALQDPAQLRALLLDNVEKVLALQEENAELKPKADSYAFLTRSDGTFCITDAAKTLGMRPKDLFAELQRLKWIYRRAGNGHWIGYSDKVQQKLLDHRVTEVTTANGETKIKEQVRITAKGMAKLGEIFRANIAAE